MRWLTLTAWIFLAQSAAAAELVHLGAPPPGTAWIELQGSGSVTPTQIAGTARPPTLVINGKNTELRPTEPGDTAGAPDALWVNGTSRPVEGESGRFFVQLSGEESAISTLEVRLRSAGKLYQATLRMGLIFLDGPIHVKKVLSPQESSTESHELLIPGELPAGAILVLEGGSSFRHGDPGVTVRVKEGASTLLAKLTYPGGDSRNISAPIQVTVRRYDPKKTVLSIEPPCDSSPDPAAPWRVPASGCKLRGVVNPGARLVLNGKPASVAPDGAFETTLEPTGERWQAHFEVTRQDGHAKVFDHAVETPDFGKAVPAAPNRWSVGRFRAGAAAVIQGSGGASYSGGADWVPRFRINDWFSATGDLGALLPSKHGGGVALLGQYGLRASIDRLPRLSGLSVELGAGGQTWFGYGETFAQAALFLSWHPTRPILKGRLEHLWIGDAMVFTPGAPTHEPQLGVGLRLF
jgi:hypothetical protein